MGRVSKCYWFLMVYAPAVLIYWPIAILVQAYKAVADYFTTEKCDDGNVDDQGRAGQV